MFEKTSRKLCSRRNKKSTHSWVSSSADKVLGHLQNFIKAPLFSTSSTVSQTRVNNHFPASLCMNRLTEKANMKCWNTGRLNNLALLRVFLHFLSFKTAQLCVRPQRNNSHCLWKARHCNSLQRFHHGKKKIPQHDYVVIALEKKIH